MSEFNPYAAPEAGIVGRHAVRPEAGEMWCDGKILVTRKGAEFPDRCVKCDQSAEGYRLKRSLSWHPSGWYLLVLVSPILYIIVALCVRWTAKAAIPLCPTHRAKRRNAMLSGWIGALLGVVLFVVGLTDQNLGVLILVGFLLIIFSAIFGLLRAQTVTPTRIDKFFVWLKGASPEFLAPLPDWVEPRV